METLQGLPKWLHVAVSVVRIFGQNALAYLRKTMLDAQTAFELC